jgi:hypothetical protein
MPQPTPPQSLTPDEDELLAEYRVLRAEHGAVKAVFVPTPSKKLSGFLDIMLKQALQADKTKHAGLLFGFAIKLARDSEVREFQYRHMTQMLANVMGAMQKTTKGDILVAADDDDLA